MAAVIAVVSWIGAGRLAETDAAIARTNHVLHHLDVVIEDMVDAESAQRGFVITGRGEFLESYERARAQLPGHLQDLIGRLESSQMAAGTRLEELAWRRMENSASTIEIRRVRGFAAAADRMARDDGLATKEIRDIAGNIRAAEMAQLSDQTDRERQSTQAGLVTVLVSTALMAVLGVGATRLLSRSIRAEKQVRDLIEEASDGFFLADLNAQYVDVNPAACRLLGYPRDGIVGKTIMDLIPPEDLPRLAAHMAFLLQPGASEVSEWLLRRSDGSYVPVEVSAKILEDRRWQAFVRDISDRKRAQAERERLLETEQRHARAREELVAVVSHDLKAPLSAILLREEILVRTLSDPRLADHARAVRRAATTMERNIRGLLDSASLEAGQLRLHMGEHDFPALVREVVDLFAPIASERGVRIACIITPMPPARCDQDRLAQVIYNLVDNAVKFTPKTGMVTIRAERSPEELRVEIADTGQGIEAKALAHIFDPYFTTEGSRGTGLGLYIAKGIIEAHGGRLHVHSERHRGSTFSFVLPQGSAG